MISFYKKKIDGYKDGCICVYNLKLNIVFNFKNLYSPYVSYINLFYFFDGKNYKLII